jgi:hypothetical protein
VSLLIKALYKSFPEHYKEALSKTYKTFDVNSFLRKWQEFINIDTFFYCRPKFKTLDDVKEAGYTLIKFNDRVLFFKNSSGSVLFSLVIISFYLINCKFALFSSIRLSITLSKTLIF